MKLTGEEILYMWKVFSNMFDELGRSYVDQETSANDMFKYFIMHLINEEVENGSKKNDK